MPNKIAEVLILTATRDVHARGIEWTLNHLGKMAHVWIGTDFPSKTRCTIGINSGNNASVKIDGLFVNVHDIEHFAVWRRRDVTSLVRNDLHPSDRAIASKECANFRDGFNFILDDICRFSANSYSGSVRAQSKALQLKLAQDCGLAIPQTILSNSSSEINRFYEKLNGDVILKSFTSPTWSGTTSSFFAYAAKLSRNLISKTEVLEACPSIFQGLIEKEYEVRALFMGRTHLAVRLDSQQSPRSTYDWRAGSTALTPIEKTVLPKDICEKCVALMKKLGIVTGSFDFAVTKKGEYVFFEVNEQGQFLWMEERCPAVPTLQVFAEFLLSGDADFEWNNEINHKISFEQYLASGHWAKAIEQENIHSVKIEARRPFPENPTNENL